MGDVAATGGGIAAAGAAGLAASADAEEPLPGATGARLRRTST